MNTGGCHTSLKNKRRADISKRNKSMRLTSFSDDTGILWWTDTDKIKKKKENING